MVLFIPFLFRERLIHGAPQARIWPSRSGTLQAEETLATRCFSCQPFSLPSNGSSRNAVHEHAGSKWQIRSWAKNSD